MSVYVEAILNKYKETENGTQLLITTPGKQIGEMLSEKRIKNAEMRFDDGRTISVEQRKKTYATIRDISEYTGYTPEEQKQWLKVLYIVKTGGKRIVDCIAVADGNDRNVTGIRCRGRSNTQVF